jgi:hypothetical protein
MICLSFDTDHLDEERMREFLAGVKIPGEATFFCTQVYRGLEATPHELCPHPTLGPGEDWGPLLDEARSEFPQARGFRAHNCVHSHLLALELSQRGYLYTSAHGGWDGSTASPYREAWGIWHLPIYYMDNLDFSFSRHWPGTDHRPFARELLEAAVNGEGVYVFDFHPIHLMLNSVSAEAYLSRRDAFLAGEEVDRLRCDGYGARDHYDELVAMMGERRLASVAMRSAVEA